MSAPISHRFPALDGVRSFAAFAVVCTHVGFISGRSLRSDLLGPILSRGDFGVALFFVLSGFLLYRPFALHVLAGAPRPRPVRFLWRRAMRILPALALFVLVTLTFITPYRVRASDYLQYLLLIQTYDHHDYDPNLAQLWTLAIEMSFYLLLPVLGALMARFAGSMRQALASQAVLLAVLAVVPVSFNLYQLHYLQGSQALLWLPAYGDWFAIGMGLAVLSCIPRTEPVAAGLHRVLGEWAAAPGTCWLIAAVLYLISSLPLGNPRTLAPALFWQWTAQHALYGAAAFFVMLPLILGQHPQLDRVLGGRIARFGGNISYSVYLWHVPLMPKVQTALGYHEFDGHFVGLLAATLGCSVAAATASWYLLERPVLRYATVPWRRSARQLGPIAPSTIAARQSS
ncbi:MAG: acyltransferase [Jatrophihabitantaceae bacterium]